MPLTAHAGHSTAPRTVMVVGGTSGIGLAVARRCVARGDAVVLVARDADRLAAVAAELAATYDDSRVLTAAADVTDRAAVQSAVDRAVEHFGRLDAVITTAQPMTYGTVEQVPPEALSRMVEVAVVGTSHLAGAALPALRRHGGGHLVVVGSLLSQVAVPSMGAYCAAKAAQHTLVRALQQETRHERGLHVSLVLPGAVDTPIYHQAATYAGSRGSAPPPVLSAEHHATAVLACLERPRRAAHVGVGNRVVVAGYRWLPWLFDRLAPRLVDLIVLRGPATGPDEGNLLHPRPSAEGPSGGWTPTGRLRRGGAGRARWRRR